MVSFTGIAASAFGEFFAHPMLLLLVGAALSGFLVPSIFRRRDDQRAQLALKTEFVSEMSECTMKLIVKLDVATARKNGGRSAEDITEANDAANQAFDDFSVRSAVLGTKLEAYVLAEAPHALPPLWSRFCELVIDFYAGHGRNERYKKAFAKKANELIRDLGLKHPGAGDRDDARDCVLMIKAALIKRLLQADLRCQPRQGDVPLRFTAPGAGGGTVRASCPLHAHRCGPGQPWQG